MASFVPGWGLSRNAVPQQHGSSLVAPITDTFAAEPQSSSSPGLLKVIRTPAGAAPTSLTDRAASLVVAFALSATASSAIRRRRKRACGASFAGSRSRGRTALAATTLKPDDVQLLTDAAAEGDPESAYLLAMAYMQGDKGIDRDEQTGMKFLVQSAENGYQFAMYDLGLLLSADSDSVSEEGVIWLQKAAEQGHPPAMYVISQLLLRGEGVQKDRPLGLQYLRESAEAGHIDAQYTFAMTLLDTPREKIQEKVWAAHYFNKAAEQKDSRSQFQIGKMFLYGIGMESDPAKAANWFSTAANAGDVNAQYMMGTMLLSGTGVDENREWAAYWFKAAAEQGNVDAMYNLGLQLESGDGVPEDKKGAIYWFQKMAESGDEEGAKMAAEAMQGMRSSGEAD